MPFGYSPEAYALLFFGGGGIGASPTAGATGNFGGGSAASAQPSSQLGQLEQLLSVLYQQAAAQNPAAANALFLDEFYRGFDTYLLLVGQDLGISQPSVQSSLTAHDNAINQNPLRQTSVGQLFGEVVFETTVFVLTTNQGGV